MMKHARGLLIAFSLLCSSDAEAATWQAGAPVLTPGPAGAFDETAVKDPSVVFFEGNWHLFYTARGQDEYTTGYVSAAKIENMTRAPRHELTQIRGQNSRYACAPQVFFFEPQRLWYLIAQTRDANYQPVYSTTKTIDRPESWSAPRILLAKDDPAKWIDFWIICDDEQAHLFYTRNHRDVILRTTSLTAFPAGWSDPRTVFTGVHEAVHIYKVQDRTEYHLIYECNERGMRSFGLAQADRLTGPWTNGTDAYATGPQLRCEPGASPWTDMVSHGEMIRSGYDQTLEYDANNPAMLIQGRLDDAPETPYPDLRWSLGLIRPSDHDSQ